MTKFYVKANSDSYELDQTWEFLLDAGISEETLEIVTSINGYSMKTLNDICRAAFEMDIDQYRNYLGYEEIED